MWCKWGYLEWQLNCNEELYIKSNKFLKSERILSYHLLVQELSRETREHPVTFTIVVYEKIYLDAYLNNQFILFRNNRAQIIFIFYIRES